MNIYDIVSGSSSQDTLRDGINQAYHEDEESLVLRLLESARLSPEETENVSQRASFLIGEVRAKLAYIDEAVIGVRIDPDGRRIEIELAHANSLPSSRGDTCRRRAPSPAPPAGRDGLISCDRGPARPRR